MDASEAFERERADLAATIATSFSDATAATESLHRNLDTLLSLGEGLAEAAAPWVALVDRETADKGE